MSIDMDPCADNDPDVYATVEAEVAHARRDRTDEIVARLMETDALTACAEPANGLYVVHEDDLPYLVRTVLSAAEPTDPTAPAHRHDQETTAEEAEK